MKQPAKIEKPGGIHLLRHSHATRRLEAGVDLHTLQRFWGLQYILSPMRLLRTLRQLLTLGHEQTLMDKLLHSKLVFYKRRKQAGEPISIAHG